jgi:hypothetical protein
MATVMSLSSIQPGLSVSRRTGPFGCLRDKPVLVVADVQNLDHGAADLGCKVHWYWLRRRLEMASARVWFHAVLARQEGDNRRTGWFSEQGWTPSAKTRRWLWFRGGRRIDANADHLFAFQVGALVSQMPVELVVIGTGDGQLAEDVAEAVQMVNSRCEVATLSLAGSTAARLDSRKSNLIAANIELGRDCLIPFQKFLSAS